MNANGDSLDTPLRSPSPADRKSAASPMTSRARCSTPPAGRLASAGMCASSASPGTSRGRQPQTCSKSSSSSATLVIELALTTTSRPPSSVAGTGEKSSTLRTGPSHEIARSGSSR